MKPRREDVFYELWLLEWWLLVDGSVIDFFLVCFFFLSQTLYKDSTLYSQHFIVININDKLFFSEGLPNLSHSCYLGMRAKKKKSLLCLFIILKAPAAPFARALNVSGCKSQFPLDVTKLLAMFPWMCSAYSNS